jgi:uncharacterized protein YgiM (DUF1202 family)
MIRMTVLLIAALAIIMYTMGKDLTEEEKIRLGVKDVVSTEIVVPDAPIVAEPVVATPAESAPESAPVAEVVEPVATVEPVVVVPQAEPEPTPDPVPAKVVWYAIKQVNVREGPSTDFAIVGKLLVGDEATLLSDPSQEWVKIEAGLLGGYVASRFLQATEPSN